MENSEKFTSMVKDNFTEKQTKLSENLKSRTNEEFIELGQVVHYHQIVEDSLVRFLKMKLPDHNGFESQLQMYGSKLRFFKGFEESSTFNQYFNALDELGYIRNQFAHTLNFKTIDISKIENIKSASNDFANYLKVGPLSNCLDYVKYFSIFFVSIMDGYLSLKEAHRERLEEIERDYNEAIESLVKS